MLTLNDLLKGEQIDPRTVLVLRHRPIEPELNKALPRLAQERPDVYNTYQQFQGEKLERAMCRAKHVASFVGPRAAEALFVGLYSVEGWKTLPREEFWKVPGNAELRKYGLRGMEEDPRASTLQFDLHLIDFWSSWKGKLTVRFPPPERSWWRWADRNEMPVIAILRESELVDPMPTWDRLALRWRDLVDLPKSWEDALRQWRAIYYIFDSSDGKGYVGSAYGEENLLGR